MRASWRRDLDRADKAERASNLICPICESPVWTYAPGKSYVVYNHANYHPDCLKEEIGDASAATPIVIGSKVRRIDEPHVVLRVREVDPEGLIDGTPKALCTNSYAHGKWMALTELEVVS